MKYHRGNIDFEWESSTKEIKNVMQGSNDLFVELTKLLNVTDKNQGHAFSLKRKFFFDKRIETICEEISNSISQIKQIDNDKILAAFLATHLFQQFTRFWHDELLKYGMFATGVSFWQEIISITKAWESKNTPTQIHKGTPFFFLAFNCLLHGDRDNAFTYLYNAIEDDAKLPLPGYPQESPAYLTATMSDKPKNYMYPHVTELRLLITNQMQKFNPLFPIRFTMLDFDTKFIYNQDLVDVVSFFVYNLQAVYDQSMNTTTDILQNPFSRLRVLDLFFNFGLIIDEILRYSSLKSGYSGKKMKDSIVWWAQNKMGLTQTQFDNLIGSRGFYLREKSPDEVLPAILSNVHNAIPNKIIKKEIYAMLVPYKLRNHAGHNLDQQKILTSRYDEIMNCMFYSLFLALQSF